MNLLLLLATDLVLQLAAPDAPQGGGGERPEPAAAGTMGRKARSAGPEDATHQAAVCLAGLSLGAAVCLLSALAVRAAAAAVLLLLVLAVLLLVLLVLRILRLLAVLLLVAAVALLLVLLVGWRPVAVLLALLGRRGVVAALVVGRVGWRRIRTLKRGEQLLVSINRVCRGERRVEYRVVPVEGSSAVRSLAAVVGSHRHHHTVVAGGRRRQRMSSNRSQTCHFWFGLGSIAVDKMTEGMMFQ